MNILTFDIEEWFHCDINAGIAGWNNYEVRIHRSTDRILEALDERKIKATFFILGWISKKYPEIVKSIQKAGHEIGCHSMYHELVHRMCPNTFRKDTVQALSELEDVLGEKVFMYRAPAFSITGKSLWALEILAELGITYDASIFPSFHDYGGFPSFGIAAPTEIKVNGTTIREFPMNTHYFMKKPMVFSGGGYFRLFPYFVIDKWTKSSDYVMAYFHPRDFDAEQPMLHHLPLSRKFKSYYGLKGAFPKFKMWLDNFETVSILDAAELIDWKKVKKFNIVSPDHKF